MKIITVPRCALVGALLVLGGCGGQDFSRSFGLSRDAPDEFTVTTRAPLSMPPDFSLRPPQPGAPRPQEQSTTQTAQVTIAGSAALAPSATPGDSPGQDALLAAAGRPAPADIRALVDSDAAKQASDHAFAEKLMFWRAPTPAGTAVDANKEAARLRENAALGKATDQGNTPVIQEKPKSFFDSLF